MTGGMGPLTGKGLPTHPAGARTGAASSQDPQPLSSSHDSPQLPVAHMKDAIVCKSSPLSTGWLLLCTWDASAGLGRHAV